ncbi:MAG: hypothetical protein AAGB19_12320 [Cyanobacteria bacterium P01_F01_bin.3]
MAFSLTKTLPEQLSAKDGLTDGNVNPANLERLSFQPGITIPDNLLVYRDQEQADAAIETITEQATLYAQSTRVVEAYSHLVEKKLAFDKAMQELRRKVAQSEITLEAAYGEWQTLKHQLATEKAKAGLLHASKVEETNIGYGAFERGLKLKLFKLTDESRNGTEFGSVRRRGHLRLVS